MKQRLEATFKGPVVFYPLLLAAFPILFLYAYNISQTSASQVWLPLAISVAAALILWAILSVILRSLAKAGLATAIFLIFFFSYGRLYDALESWGAFVPQHAYLLPGMLFIWGYCVYFISLAKRDFRVTTKILNVMAVALIAINLFNIASYEIRLARLSGVTPGNSTGQTASNSTKPNALPDIYFIILDEYANPDTMKEYYNYDNSEFIKRLKDKGFFIAGGSKTTSDDTVLCLAQRLNMEYLEYGPLSDDTYRELAYSKAEDFLKAKGYQYIYFGCWYDIGRYDNYMRDSADLYFNYYEEAATRWVSEFQEILWSTTMLKPFYYHLVGTQYESACRRQTLYTLEHLKTLPEMAGPKFVVAHICCPHPPWVFGPKGEEVPVEDWTNRSDRQFYLGQYIFMSTEIEKVIDELLKKSEIPPIIIVQSDHGVRVSDCPYVGDNEWKKIFNAMYLPGMDYSELQDSISPVNTFRLIFNHYFGANYPLLEDVKSSN
jgi:hypothetical protein